MRVWCCLGVLVALLGVLAPGAGADDILPTPEPGELAPKDPIFHAELSYGIELVYNDDYELALSLLDSLQKVHPDHPAPYFYEAATLQTWMSSYRFNGFQDRLEKSVERAIEAGKALTQKRPDDPWIDFYMGGAYGYRAFYKFRRFNWLGAYKDGTKGIDHLRICLKKDPKLYDAYLGLGSYYYWRTARSKVLRWLLFFLPDKRDFGLSLIGVSMQHGRYCQDESRLVLVTALYDYEKYERALAVLDEMPERDRPPNMFELYLRARLVEAMGQWAEAEAAFRVLMDRLDAAPRAVPGYRAECRYRLARALVALGRNEEALPLAQEAMVLSARRDPDAELDSALNDFEDMKKDLERLYRKLMDERR